MAFTPDSRFLLSASGDGTVRVWDVAQLKPTMDLQQACRILRPSGTQRDSLSQPVFTSLSVDFSSTFVAAGSLDGFIRVWNILPASDSGVPLGGISAHADGVYGVQFLPGDGDSKEMTLVSASLDRSLKRWRLIANKAEFICEKTLVGHEVTPLLLKITIRNQNRPHRIAC